jgi:urease accessory protein UreE
VIYEDVLSNADKMNAMLTYAKGNRHVPVIVDQGSVVIGFNGKS